MVDGASVNGHVIYYQLLKSKVVIRMDKKTQEFQEFELQIIFEYYKEQKQEIQELGRERLSLALQYLAIIASLVILYIQDNVPSFILVGISVTICLLGIVGLWLNVNIERTRKSHFERTRAARKKIEFLEDIASAGKDFATTHLFYYFTYVIVIIVGILFFLAALSN